MIFLYFFLHISIDKQVLHVEYYLITFFEVWVCYQKWIFLFHLLFNSMCILIILYIITKYFYNSFSLSRDTFWCSMQAVDRKPGHTIPIEVNYWMYNQIQYNIFLYVKNHRPCFDTIICIWELSSTLVWGYSIAVCYAAHSSNENRLPNKASVEKVFWQ